MNAVLLRRPEVTAPSDRAPRERARCAGSSNRSVVRFDVRASSEPETVHEVPIVAAFARVGIAARIPLGSAAPSSGR
jgi:hypothetical protein